MMRTLKKKLKLIKKQMNRTNAVWKPIQRIMFIIEPEVDVNPPVQVH